MINITEVQIKETKKGDPYKLLKLEGGNQVAMWADDPDYNLAVDGAELTRDIQQQGKYWNLLPSGATPTTETTNSQPTTNAGLEELNKKIGAVYFLVQKIAEHLKVDEGLETPKVEYPDVNINPDDIPFN